jgi:8-oxo-dGTP pyrophosphatase MutT (NUDIX family)
VLTNEVRPRRGTAVAPRDASSLILMRVGGDVPSVLLGRRSTAARFMPGYYVFPGGRVGPEDRLQSRTNEKGSRGNSDHALLLKRAAIRETFEETGLLLGHPVLHTRDRLTRSPLERACEAQGLDPAIDALKYIGRAITPRESPIRFNTRFFVADGELAHGELASNGELDDLGWRPIEECRFLAMADVTRFMLEHAMRCRTGARHDLVVYHYVKGVPRVRHETVQEG